MGLIDNIKRVFTPRERTVHSSMRLNNTFSVDFDGEKNLGEIGNIIAYNIDYNGLRLRSWQSYLESEITQTVMNKFRLWVIANGLKLQSQPIKQVLESEGIKLDSEKFNEVTEMRWAVWSKSKQSSYNSMESLNDLAKDAFMNSKVGGDALVVLRVIKGKVKVQLIDGYHLCSPSFDGSVLANGNCIKNGIEMSPTGEHIAYHIKDKNYNFERIEAKSKSTGLVMAFLVKGLKYRLDNNRGIPLVSAVLETLKKLERYKEATVGSAEEVAKIAYQIVHQAYSTGENPLAKQLSKAFDANATDIPADAEGRQLANTVAATTNKSAYNNPVGAEIKTLNQGNGQIIFKDFYSVNIDLVCSAVGIPPNVAMSLYNDSFSASRAATKDWEHTIMVNRDDFTFQFYQPIYNLWLHLEILQSKIPAPQYLNAFSVNNEMVLDAYRNARFTGPMFPHIDPLKEVKAEREKLGELGRNIPLTTVEQATEALMGGDSDSNIEQFGIELKYARENGLVDPPTVAKV